MRATNLIKVMFVCRGERNAKPLYIPTTGVHFIASQVKIFIRKLLGHF